MIPLVDLSRQHTPLVDEILAVTREILQQGAFVGGAHVENFEREWAGFCGVREAIGVSSGTDALRFALIASGIQRGEEVITVPMTFVATVEAILQAGARPVLVDIDPATCTLDPTRLERAVTAKTKAILPVHLYGHPANMDDIRDCAKRHGITVIEDAAQAHGATYKERRAGSLGHAAAFSFYPAKNLGACGEAGAVTTNDSVLAQEVRMLRDHGQFTKNQHEIEGYNGRLDALQAAVLRIKLRHLPQWNERRRALAFSYGRLLADAPGLILPKEAPWARSAYHLYVVRSSRRNELREKLAQAGISTGLHYPRPVHAHKAFASLGYQAGSFPVSERLAREALSLPLYPELTAEAQQLICDQIRSILSS